MEKESLFLSYVRLTLKKWVGFQAALEEGMGGPFAREKEIWLGNEIENYFKCYNNVKPDDMEEYIGTIMENEFDSYFEDGSLLEISKHFCQAYEMSLINPVSPIFEEVLKKREELLKSYNEHIKMPSQRVEVNSENSVIADMEQLNIKGEDEDQWTLVTRKIRKK